MLPGRANMRGMARGNIQRLVSLVAKSAAGQVPRLLLLLGFGVMLASCDKCHLPTWSKKGADGVPLSCHSDASQPQ